MPLISDSPAGCARCEVRSRIQVIFNAGTTFNFGQTSDASPIYRFTLSAGLGSGESIVVRRGTTTVAVSLSQPGCGVNCYEFSAPTATTIVTNVTSIGAALLPAPSGSTFQSVGTAAISVQVVDSAGNESASVASLTVNVGYFPCSQQRADATHQALWNSPHPVAISRAVGTTVRCSSCHLVQPADPAIPNPPTSIPPTPAGNFVGVPSGTATYWCKRPA